MNANAVRVWCMEISRSLPLVFPVHPRTSNQLVQFGLLDKLGQENGIHLLEPIGYVPFMNLVRQSKLVITDSGGIQEETTYLGIPCLTVRQNTERPITVTEGTNRLAEPEELHGFVGEVLAGKWPRGRRPELWDGHTAQRVAASLKQALSPRTEGR